jgi:hypothetical protein
LVEKKNGRGTRFRFAPPNRPTDPPPPPTPTEPSQVAQPTPAGSTEEQAAAGGSSPQQPTQAANGGFGTLGEYRSHLRHLLEEQRSAQKAARNFEQRLQQLAQGHEAAARELSAQERQLQQTEARMKAAPASQRISAMPALSTMAGLPLAAAPAVQQSPKGPGLSGFQNTGLQDSIQPTSTEQEDRAQALRPFNSLLTPVAISEDKSEAEPKSAHRSGLTISAPEMREVAKSDSAIPHERASAGAAAILSLKESLRSKLARNKHNENEPAAADPPKSLAEADLPPATGAGRSLAQSEPDRRERRGSDGAFYLAGSETDAAVRKMVGEIDGPQTSRDILGMHTEELFQRVRAAHRRSQTKGGLL